MHMSHLKQVLGVALASAFMFGCGPHYYRPTSNDQASSFAAQGQNGSGTCTHLNDPIPFSGKNISVLNGIQGGFAPASPLLIGGSGAGGEYSADTLGNTIKLNLTSTPGNAPVYSVTGTISLTSDEVAAVVSTWKAESGFDPGAPNVTESSLCVTGVGLNLSVASQASSASLRVSGPIEIYVTGDNIQHTVSFTF